MRCDGERGLVGDPGSTDVHVVGACLSGDLLPLPSLARVGLRAGEVTGDLGVSDAGMKAKKGRGDACADESIEVGGALDGANRADMPESPAAARRVARF